MGRSATPAGKVAAHCRTHEHLVPALIVVALTLVLPASATASRAAGNGRTFEVGVAQTSGLGTIVVDSQPTSADVRLDGVDAGLSTSTTFTGVTPGDHQVSVSIPGFQPWEQTVSVTADATTTVQAALLVELPGNRGRRDHRDNPRRQPRRRVGGPYPAASRSAILSAASGRRPSDTFRRNSRLIDRVATSPQPRRRHSDQGDVR